MRDISEFLVKWKLLDGSRWKRGKDVISADPPFGEDEALDILDRVIDMSHAEAMDKAPSFHQAHLAAMFPATWEIVSVEAIK